MAKRVAIVGAGITGLVCARELQRRGVSATIFEASDRVGGAIGTERRDGFLAERGPHTFMESNATLRELVDDLGLTEERVYASEAAHRRYMVRDGKPQALPGSPPALLRTPAFSPRAKLALLREPFVARRDDGVDESVTMFVKRRLNRELLDYGLELLVNGVWAGDPNRLSARYAFPKMFALERDYGSLLRGAIARSRQGHKRPRMFAFRSGNETLIAALAAELEDVRLNSPVESVVRDETTWTVDGESFDAVVLTVGASAFTNLEVVVDETPLDFDFMGEIAYPSLAVVTLGFRTADVPHPLDGFGMIAPVREGLDLLGALFTSTLFPGRAPAGHVTLACFVGGMRRPDLAELSPDERVQRTLAALRQTLGVRGEPVFIDQTVWPEAIPQYEVGYGRLLAQMEALEHAHPGFHMAGNLRGHVAVPDLVESGVKLADNLARSA